MDWERYTGKKIKGTWLVECGETLPAKESEQVKKFLEPGIPVVGTGSPMPVIGTVRHYIAGRAIESGDLVAYKSDDTVVPVLNQEEMTPTFEDVWSDIRQAWSNEHIHRSEATIEVAMIKEAIHVLFDRLMDEMDARTPTDEE